MAKKNLVAASFVLALLISTGASLAEHEDVSEICRMSISLYRNGEFEKSVSILKQAVEKEKSTQQPNDEDLLSLYRNLIVVLNGWKHNDEAKEFEHLAEKLEKVHIEAPLAVSHLNGANNRDKKTPQPKREKLRGGIFAAVFGFPALLKMDNANKVPERLEAYDKAAALLRDSTDDCLKETTESLKKFPNDKYLLMMRATCLVRKNQGLAALSEFSKCGLPPAGMTLAPFCFSMGTAFLQVKDYHSAVTAFDKAIAMKSVPLAPSVIINRAIALCQLGKATEAAADLLKVETMGNASPAAKAAAYYYWHGVAEKNSRE